MTKRYTKGVERGLLRLIESSEGDLADLRARLQRARDARAEAKKGDRPARRGWQPMTEFRDDAAFQGARAHAEDLAETIEWLRAQHERRAGQPPEAFPGERELDAAVAHRFRAQDGEPVVDLFTESTS